MKSLANSAALKNTDALQAYVISPAEQTVVPSDVVQQVTDYTEQATASQKSDDLVSDTNTQQTEQLTLSNNRG